MLLQIQERIFFGILILRFVDFQALTLAERERKLQFNAIKAVHAHLDDDEDGNINIEESVEVNTLTIY